ncbi:unnamed protein product, partial [Ectocarpus sp. 13 AM-2016]
CAGKQDSLHQNRPEAGTQLQQPSEVHGERATCEAWIPWDHQEDKFIVKGATQHLPPGRPHIFLLFGGKMACTVRPHPGCRCNLTNAVRPVLNTWDVVWSRAAGWIISMLNLVGRSVRD